MSRQIDIEPPDVTKNEGNTLVTQEKNVLETPLEVSRTHPILSCVAQKDITFIQEAFDFRNVEENVDNTSLTPYMWKSH